MEDASRLFRLVRQPRKPGSGRLHRQLELPLTTSVAGAALTRKRRGFPKSEEQLATDGKDLQPTPCTLQAGHPTSSAVAPVEQMEIPHADKQVPVLEPQRTVLHAFDSSEGRKRRVLVLAVPARGSRRRAQPRTFTLAFKPPPIKQRTPVASPIVALQPRSPAAPTPEPVVVQVDEPALRPADVPTVSATSESQGVEFEPQLEDLVVLAFEAARAVELRRQAMRAAAVEAGVAAAIAHAAAAAEEAALAEAVAVQAMQPAAEVPAPAQTPAPFRSQPWPAHVTPARLHTTPIEGVPERLTVRKVIESVAPLSVGGLLATPIEGVPERFTVRKTRDFPGTAEGREFCSTSVGMTPVEGVPERLLKRPRLSAAFEALLPRPQLCGGALAAPHTPQTQAELESLVEDRIGQQRESAEGAARLHPQLGVGVSAISLVRAEDCNPNPHGEGSCNDGDGPGLPYLDNTAAEPAAADMTAADIAAAVSAAARVALQRIRPYRSLTPLARIEPPAEAATSSHTCVTTPGEPATSTSSGTPAVVKMQNLAAAAASAVQRAAAAMGGPPSCVTLQGRPRLSLPPRPPSAGCRAPAAAPVGTAQSGGHGDAIAQAVTGSRRTSCVSDGPQNVGDLIHRAPPGTLIFPSRTPSPMGGFRWPPVPQGTTPQLHPGVVPDAVLVTPTLEGAAATLAKGHAAQAGTGFATAASTPDVAGQPSPAVGGSHAARNSSGAAAPCTIGIGGDRAIAPGMSAGTAATPVLVTADVCDSGGHGDDGEWGPDLADDDPCGGCAEDADAEGLDGISVLRHDDDQHGTDDEAVAMEEVMALPEEPQAGRAAAHNGSISAAAAGGRCRSSSSGGRASVAGAGGSGQSGERGASGPASSGRDAGGASSAEGIRNDNAVTGGVQGTQQQREGTSQEGRKQRERAAAEGYAHERRLAVNRKSLAGEGLTVGDLGTRRSTRNRVRPLQYWRGESKSYGRTHNTLPTVKAITIRTPEPKWPLPTDMHEKAKRKARAKQATQATAKDA